MRTLRVNIQGCPAGMLTELEKDRSYVFEYDEGYCGECVSLTMPVDKKKYTFNTFPPFFDGLLPEGLQLEALLKRAKLDRSDLFSQLEIVGSDLVGTVTVERGIV